jgi:hypothetical protein
MVVSVKLAIFQNKHTQDILTSTLPASDGKSVNCVLALLKFVGSLNVSSQKIYFSLKKSTYFEVMWFCLIPYFTRVFKCPASQEITWSINRAEKIPLRSKHQRKST